MTKGHQDAPCPLCQQEPPLEERDPSSRDKTPLVMKWPRKELSALPVRDSDEEKRIKLECDLNSLKKQLKLKEEQQQLELEEQVRSGLALAFTLEDSQQRGQKLQKILDDFNFDDHGSKRLRVYYAEIVELAEILKGSSGEAKTTWTYFQKLTSSRQRKEFIELEKILAKIADLQEKQKVRGDFAKSASGCQDNFIALERLKQQWRELTNGGAVPEDYPTEEPQTDWRLRNIQLGKQIQFMRESIVSAEIRKILDASKTPLIEQKELNELAATDAGHIYTEGRFDMAVACEKFKRFKEGGGCPEEAVEKFKELKDLYVTDKRFSPNEVEARVALEWLGADRAYSLLEEKLDQIFQTKTQSNWFCFFGGQKKDVQKDILNILAGEIKRNYVSDSKKEVKQAKPQVE